MTIDAKTLKIFARRKKNVLLRGRHGVGKTALIKETFNEVFGEMGKNWLYFSASTLDPWVDLIGIPKNFTRPDGVEVFKLIPPEHFTGEEDIRAVFFDEINRTPDNKTLNAIMEFIQFKSINGRKFKNLEVVWGAENPAEDGAYMVMPMDPAQKDRFQIQVDVPYEVNMPYFNEKHGKSATKIAVKWWEKQKDTISPRKLDDMLDGWAEGLDLMYFSNDCKTLNELQHALSSVKFIETARKVADSKDANAIRTFFNVPSLRKFSKNLADEYDILSAIYEHVDGESQSMIRKDMNYTPPIKSADIDSDDFLLDKAQFEKIESFVRTYDAKYSNTQTNSTGFDFLRNSSNRAQNIFGPYLRNDASEYVALETIVKSLGPDRVLRSIFGERFDVNIMNSGVYKNASALSQTQLTAFKTLGRMILICLRGRQNEVGGDNIYSDAFNLIRNMNSSSLMSKALSRNPVRNKACMNNINSNPRPMTETVTDYIKIYG